MIMRENKKATKTKSIADAIREILKSGGKVRSSILGCMGEIERVDPDEATLFLKKTSRRRLGGCFGANEPEKNSKTAIKKVGGVWIYSHRKSYVRKLMRQNPGSLVGIALGVAI
jgi:hypothetical protein